MTAQKFDPVREFASLRDSVSRALGQSIQAAAGGVYPLVDIYKTDQAVIMRTAPLDGRLENIEVSMEDDLLNISGETKSEDDLPIEAYLHRERRFGKFSRSLRIPWPVKAEEAVAQFKNGILTITLPKADDTLTQVSEDETAD